ncbi:uncharacterized protein L201_004764 [Kwoniella dendrophila CBS 6074]|uniref:RRM domain-containing protein n=1 Tax=Kwoniella dendrophila CBS 6074 TaxID=1295534 RepID=A0AAX4JWR5_9TREE
MVEAVLNPIKQATENVVNAANEFVSGKPSEDEQKVADIPKEEDGHRVYIGNISYSTTEEQVREFVAPAGGDIKSVNLPLKFGKRPAGYAFVTYNNEADANKAIEQLKDKEFGDRKVKIELARPAEKVLEIRKARDEKRKANREAIQAKKAEKAEAAKSEAAPATNGTSTETDAKAANGEEKPKKKKNAAKPKAKKPRRRLPGEGDEGEAEGETSADAEEVKPATKGRIDVNGAADGEAKEKTKKAPRTKKEPTEPRAPREPRPRLELTGDDSKNTIFVANLPFSVDDEALATIFTNLSIKVKSAKVVQGIRRPRPDATRKFRPFKASKGFGFVEIENDSEQAQAVEKVDGTLVEDRKITAKIAKEMKAVEQAEVADNETTTA